jgi:hypothetical protein
MLIGLFRHCHADSTVRHGAAGIPSTQGMVCTVFYIKKLLDTIYFLPKCLIFFADDSRSPLSFERANELQPIINLYNQYTTVSVLNINIRKKLLA